MTARMTPIPHSYLLRMAGFRLPERLAPGTGFRVVMLFTEDLPLEVTHVHLPSEIGGAAGWELKAFQADDQTMKGPNVEASVADFNFMLSKHPDLFVVREKMMIHLINRTPEPQRLSGVASLYRKEG